MGTRVVACRLCHARCSHYTRIICLLLPPFLRLATQARRPSTEYLREATTAANAAQLYTEDMPFSPPRAAAPCHARRASRSTQRCRHVVAARLAPHAYRRSLERRRMTPLTISGFARMIRVTYHDARTIGHPMSRRRVPRGERSPPSPRYAQRHVFTPVASHRRATRVTPV